MMHHLSCHNSGQGHFSISNFYLGGFNRFFCLNQFDQSSVNIGSFDSFNETIYLIKAQYTPFVSAYKQGAAVFTNAAVFRAFTGTRKAGGIAIHKSDKVVDFASVTALDSKLIFHSFTPHQSKRCRNGKCVLVNSQLTKINKVVRMPILASTGAKVACRLVRSLEIFLEFTKETKNE